jgi:hypothetical protein
VPWLFLLPSAAAYVYYTPDALLAELFPAGEHIESWTPDADDKAGIEATLGYKLPKATWDIHVGTDGHYAILDQQLGQHEPIDFGVLLDGQATVVRVEILAYREAYGDGVRSPVFRQQFAGLGPSAPMRPGKDIKIVSGATISTRSISTGVRRAAVVLAAWLRR